MLPKCTAERPGSTVEKDRAWLMATRIGGVAEHLTPIRLWIEYEVERVGYFTPVPIPKHAERP